MIFEKPGPMNTEMLLDIVKEAVETQHIHTVILASTSGKTALLLLEVLNGINSWGISSAGDGGDGGQTRTINPKAQNKIKLVVVSHVSGFESPDLVDMPHEVRTELENAGAKVVTAAHSLGGIGRAARIKFGTYGTDELIAHALRLFGEGTKVAVEVAMMAADAGAVSTLERVIAIGGTSHGADTAVILQPANTHRFFDIRVDEILCKPAVSKAWLKQSQQKPQIEGNQAGTETIGQPITGESPKPNIDIDLEKEAKL